MTISILIYLPKKTKQLGVSKNLKMFFEEQIIKLSRTDFPPICMHGCGRKTNIILINFESNELKLIILLSGSTNLLSNFLN